MTSIDDRIMILDFGSQYTQLIARRIRELGVFTEIRAHDTALEDIQASGAKGVILSGGPNSLSSNILEIDRRLLEGRIPVLGVCYGMQLMNHLCGGTVRPLDKGEYGRHQLRIEHPSPLFVDVESGETVWMSHRDSVEVLAPHFHIIGVSEDGIPAAIQHDSIPLYGLQFHPEVAHTTRGRQILANFLELCDCQRSWTMENYIETLLTEIQTQVGKRKVISLVSGGVDSTVATCLCQQALGSDQVHALYIDTGLMRENETVEVKKMFADQGVTHLQVIHAADEFLTALSGVSEPETKRRIIGTKFIEIVNREMERLGLASDDTLFCQGTLYTDLIESGKGCGKQAAVIKTHHNVNPPIVEAKRAQGLIVEPNREIFKDEVRTLGELLHLPKHMVWRHPFPGPGLAIRILGAITPERLCMLRRADTIYLEEIRRAGLYDQIWQAFAVLLPVNTVGVMGDQRTEGHAVALRAVTSSDGMTADFFDFPHDVMRRISTRIINEVEGVNRVTYDVTSKPPGTIEWE
ncbi:MAG: glutamine-hydrolyzing GMP synthase [Chlamydiia bacterium]|nr:glutamine-hydrolyzing GMP synthase [Chlamydiia bacterium]